MLTVVIVDVIVIVIDTVIVAVHVNVNATVVVIRPVDGSHATAARTGRRDDLARSRKLVRCHSSTW